MITFPYAFIVLPLLLSFLTTAILTPIFILINKKIGLVDDPKRRNHPAIIHKKPIPRGGGLPLFLGVFLIGIFFLPHTSEMTALFAAGFLALITGLFDDVMNAKGKDISPYIRFPINIVTAIIVVASGISIKFITNPIGGFIHFDAIILAFPFVSVTLSDLITVIWLVWIMNMLNWSKGVDGQMPGIVAISAIVIGIVTLRLSSPMSNSLDAILSFLIAGSSIGFLLYNFYPAKIFPGFGATSLYLLLGVASILSSAKLATAILVLGVPFVDFIFTILRRIINRKSPFKGDNKHLHHILLRLGYTQRQVALFYWGISGILGIISLTLESRSKIFAMIMLGVIIGGAILFLHIVTKNINEEVTS